MIKWNGSQGECETIRKGSTALWSYAPCAPKGCCFLLPFIYIYTENGQNDFPLDFFFKIVSDLEYLRNWRKCFSFISSITLCHTIYIDEYSKNDLINEWFQLLKFIQKIKFLSIQIYILAFHKNLNIPSFFMPLLRSYLEDSFILLFL